MYKGKKKLSCLKYSPHPNHKGDPVNWSDMWHLWLNTSSDWNKHSSSRRWVRGKWQLGRLFSRIRLTSAQCDTFLLTAILNGHLVRVCSSHVHVLSNFSIYLQYSGGRGSTGQCRYDLGSKPNHIAVEHHCISKAAKRTGWRSGFQDTRCCCKPVMQSSFSFRELVFILLRRVGTGRGMTKVSSTLPYEKCTYCVLPFKNKMSLVHDKHESSLHILMFVSPPLLESLQERGAKSC